uniref:Thioredoxin domain-containing protein n=1 Tax=Parascaris univalens TaxID=6257 RepID=A0A915B063_PARUN
MDARHIICCLPAIALSIKHNRCKEMAELLSNVQLQKKNGSLTKGSEALEGKVVALYFSAHWCPPCRQFTPVLKDFYEELDGEAFEIVFVSFDRSENDLKEYMEEAHGDWYFIPFGSDEIQELAKKFDVSGIPALVVIKSNGDVITKNGRADVSSRSPAQALGAWKAAA